MKKIIILTVLSFFTFISRAQFVLTPNDGLKTADGVYTIKRVGTELDNYQAAMKAVKTVIPDAVIEEPEFEKVFTVKAKTNIKMKVAMMLKSLMFTAEYTLKIEAEDNLILVSYEKLGQFEYRKKNNVAYLYPWSGHNSYMVQMGQEYYLFNSSGDLKAPKAKTSIEEWANGLVSQIEQALK